MRKRARTIGAAAVSALLASMSIAATNPALAQTQEEIDLATKILKRPQTKSSTLSFFAGVALGMKDYAKAIEYYEKMCALYELDDGPLSCKLAWACAKQAECEKLLGHTQKATDLVSKSRSIMASWKEPPKGFEEYLEEAKRLCDSVSEKGDATAVSETTKVANAIRGKQSMIEAQKATVALRSGNLEEAIAHFNAGIDACEIPEEDSFRALMMVKLGDLLIAHKELEAAETVFNDVEKVETRSPKAVDPLDRISVERGLAAVKLKQGKTEESEKMLLHALGLYKNVEPQEKKFRATWLIEMITTRVILAALYQTTDRKEKADQERELIKSLEKEHEEIMRSLE